MTSEPAADPRHRVVALALPGVIVFDLSIPAQVFGGREQAGRYRFEVCTPVPGRVPTSTSFGLDVDLGLEALEQADTVVVPGFRPLVPPGDEVVEALRSAVRRDARVASVCVGAFALGYANLLDGRPATTHWREAEAFRQLFPEVRLHPDVLYVDDGQILTSAGLSAGIDLCLHLVRRDFGAVAALESARQMVVARHRPGGQLQYTQQVDADDGWSDVLEWMVAELGRPLTVPQLARRAGLPVRTFTRRFRERTGLTPMRWLDAQRLLEAERLLEATGLPVEEIAWRCGFGTAAALRQRMRRERDTTPTAYRAAHAANASVAEIG